MSGRGTELEDFEATVRQFFEKLPAALDGVDGEVARGKHYRSLLVAEGLAGVSYPVEFGGQGLTAEHQAAYDRASIELLPPEESVFGIGLGMALPTILGNGSDEQKRRFIPPGLAGEEIWCQLYSEPGAGSDLAGLTTQAVRDGDEWVITGQKVWTSGAQDSDLAILLARTDQTAAKHAGITMFVLPMHQPGVEVRPLVQMTGAQEFNEVFLTEARVPASWVLGDINQGWSLAVALLAHERKTLGRGVTTSDEAKSKAGRAPLQYDGLVTRARDAGAIDDLTIRQELAAVHTGERLILWNAERQLHPSIGKLWRTIQGRRAAQLAHVLGGPEAVAWEHDDVEADYWAYHVLNCRGMSLGGGTDEVQKNTLGERVLGLPRGPGIDRRTPFNELPRN